MRPGLVAIGIGLVLLGGAVLLAVFEGSGPGGGDTTHFLTVTLPNGENASAWIWGLNGSGVRVAIAWHASGNVDAVLSTPSGCSGDPRLCPPGPVLEHWTPGSTAGSWSTSAPPGFPWLLRIVNSGPVPVRIDVTITAVRAPAPSTLGWANDIDLVGGATLGGIGALSLFLGLFLQGGVYRSSRPPPAPESPSAPGPPGH